MLTAKEVEELIQRQDRAKVNLARLEGALGKYMQELKELGFDSVQKATAACEALYNSVEKQERILARRLQRIQKEIPETPDD